MGNGRILIAGGTGFLGRPLAATLARNGYEVVVLTRDPATAKPIAGGRLAAWDGSTAEGWGALADGAYAIVNLAGDNIGEGRWTQAKKQRVIASRLHAGAAIVAAVSAARRKPAVLLQASAVGYYGDRADEELADDAPAGSGFLAETCVAWEASTAAVEAQGVRRAVARTGVVLDMAGGALPKIALPYRLGAGGPMGTGRQWMPWIHLHDEIAALAFLLETATARGAFNVCAPHPLRNAELGQEIGRVLHRPSLLPAPTFALRLALGEMSALVLQSQRCIPAKLLALGFTFRFPEAAAALRDALGRRESGAGE